jgi:hypothetical protein
VNAASEQNRDHRLWPRCTRGCEACHSSAAAPLYRPYDPQFPSARSFEGNRRDRRPMFATLFLRRYRHAGDSDSREHWQRHRLRSGRAVWWARSRRREGSHPCRQRVPRQRHCSRRFHHFAGDAHLGNMPRGQTRQSRGEDGTQGPASQERHVSSSFSGQCAGSANRRARFLVSAGGESGSRSNSGQQTAAIPHRIDLASISVCPQRGILNGEKRRVRISAEFEISALSLISVTL